MSEAVAAPFELARTAYLERIEDAYQGGVYAESLFATLASQAPRAARAEKWRVLERLVRDTLERIRPILVRLGGAVAADPARRALGVQHGSDLAGRRWLDFMDLLLVEVTRSIERFEQLERLAEPADARVLARVTAHEVALQSFARLELAGRGRESLRPALALLAAPPPQTPRAASS